MARARGWSPLDSPLVSLGYPGIYRYTKQWAPREPLVFVNLFNNIWGTNFQQWIGGSWSSRVRLWPKTDEALLVEQSWAARSPCLAAVADGAAGSLPATQGGVSPSSRAVLVTAFAPGGGGRPWLLRLWEQAGRSSHMPGRPAGRIESGLSPNRATSAGAAWAGRSRSAMEASFIRPTSSPRRAFCSNRSNGSNGRPAKRRPSSRVSRYPLAGHRQLKAGRGGHETHRLLQRCTSWLRVAVTANGYGRTLGRRSWFASRRVEPLLHCSRKLAGRTYRPGKRSFHRGRDGPAHVPPTEVARFGESRFDPAGRPTLHAELRPASFP